MFVFKKNKHIELTHYFKDDIYTKTHIYTNVYIL